MTPVSPALVLVAILVLAAAVAPLVRLLAARPFRRKLRSFPRTMLALGGLGLAAVTGVALTARFAPGVLLLAASVAGVALLVAAWRARPAYGRRRGLPPGSLGLLPVGPLVDDRFFLRAAARHGPVFKTSQYARPMVCVVGLGRISEILRRYDDVLDPPALPFDAFVPGGFIRSMTAEAHAATAARLRPLAGRDALTGQGPAIAAMARRTLGAMAAEGGCDGVAPGPPLRALCFTVLLRVLFGIAPDDPAHAELRRLYAVLDVRRPSGAVRARARPALDAIAMLVTKDATRGARADGVLAAIARADPAAGTDPTLVGNLVYVVQNARDDTAGLLVWTLKMLADHPAWAEALATTTEPEGLALRIALETLRLEQSEFLYRRVRAPIMVDGFRVPAGWMLRLCVRESHRDPALYPDPERFDPARFLTPPGRDAYAPFGAPSGRHTCLGEALAKTIASIALAELARGFTWRVVADGPREFDGWHWTPSPEFRITLTPRPDRSAGADPV